MATVCLWAPVNRSECSVGTFVRKKGQNENCFAPLKKGMCVLVVVVGNTHWMQSAISLCGAFEFWQLVACLHVAMTAHRGRPLTLLGQNDQDSLASMVCCFKSGVTGAGSKNCLGSKAGLLNRFAGDAQRTAATNHFGMWVPELHGDHQGSTRRSFWQECKLNADH